MQLQGETMSIEYLLLAARNELRTQMASSAPGSANINSYIGIQPEGHPPANCGEFYIALDEESVQSTEKTSLREVYSISVYITKRTGKYSADHWDAIYTDATNGLRALERKVIQYIHGSHTIRIAANTLGGFPASGTGDIFQQPLWYLGRPKTRFVGGPAAGEWDGSGSDGGAYAIRMLRFSGAVRVQARDVMH